ncbi:hypothetical protein DPMN_096864 [Dreissena polymorpha]|uniref:Phospholipid/glycerol acyltransferase domain-containing protein n=2 Tax=Dreissena polymorpha TaxID=45954 RepID=A0A9D4R556_DREPO|nr:hypothetical protein DPMN_096864 [Dreissena polymorpha]
MYEVLFGTKVRIYGRIASNEDATLMIMNHRTRFDWLYLFSFQVRHASIRRYTISLKNMLKMLPGIGWAMQIAGYIFLDRKWEEDQENITKCLKVFQEVKCRPQILLFPEGTDLTTHTKARSDAYAEKNSLPKYTYLLHPRTTGFTHFVQEMKKGGILDKVMDITIAYPRGIPQNEMDIIRGNFAKEIHFLIQTFPNSEIPSGKDQLNQWCCERWRIKETVLNNFYEKKSFSSEEPELITNESLVRALFMYAWVTWSLLQLSFAYFLWVYPALWVYVVLCTIFYVSVSKFTKGFNILIADAIKK